MIRVVWVSYKQPDIIARGYWDHGLLERIFDRRIWTPVGAHEYTHYTDFGDVPEGEGAVVVVPAQHHHDQVKRLNRDLARLSWCLLILTGDECALFPWRSIIHPNLRLWIMTPRPETHADSGARFIGEGWHVDTPDVIATIPLDAERTDWFFAGQVTHQRREECVAALKDVPNGELIETPGFTQGLDRHDYLQRLGRAKIAPAPSGPGTPDSFRLFEALEAGTVPLADAVTPEGWTGYWDLLLGKPPFPVVEDWGAAPEIIEAILGVWPEYAARLTAWWQQYKRNLVYMMDSDVTDLSDLPGRVDQPSDRVTVIMPTSVIPSHPDTRIIEETIGSIREQPGLAHAEIMVMADGIRAEQADCRDRYDEYLRRLTLLAMRLRNVVVYVADEHLHQGCLTRNALKHVRTPTVLFVEHDTPICGDIPWTELTMAVMSGQANVIRFHHEALVLKVHQHLMLDKIPVKIHGAPLLRTVQWSQRPHLASTDFYREMIDTYFGSKSRTMIEDVMHGVVDQAWREHGVEGWDQFKLWMFAPNGDIKRSLHSDGRGEDPKYDMLYAYDGDKPEGAPAPTAGRVD